LTLSAGCAATAATAAMQVRASQAVVPPNPG
jgi:hypothetical protein